MNIPKKINIDEDLMHFKYIIITPKKKIEMDTYFNRFDRNIFNSINYLELISMLPIDFYELKFGWPISANRYESNNHYSVQYINESIIDEKTLLYISRYLYGAIFILDGVSEKTISSLVSMVKMPVVTIENFKGCLKYNWNMYEDIFKYWKVSTDELLDNKSKDTQKILSLFQHKNYTNLNGFDTYSAHFLDPLSRGINRLRGIYLKTSEKNNILPPTPITDEAFRKNEYELKVEVLRVVKNFIAEKYLLFMIGLLEEDSLSEEIEVNLKEVGLSKELLAQILKDNGGDSYSAALETLLNSFEKIDYRTDIVLSVPSVNYNLLKKTNNLLGRDKISNKILKLIYESSNYRYVIDNGIFNKQKRDEEQNTFFFLLKERGIEMALLSKMSLMYALGRRLPYIRTQNIPSQAFYTLAEACFKLADNMEARNTTSKFVRKTNEISEFLLDHLNPDLMDTIITNGNHIKVMSDLPLEWIKVQNLPLCIHKSYSRVPITPGNNIVSHSYLLSTNHSLSQNNIEILIINTLETKDILYPLGKSLVVEMDKYLALINKKAKYKEIGSKQELINTIESEKPTILIYYGHGHYNISEGEGELIIGNEKLTAIEIETIKHSPLITILGACETQILNGTHLNTAALMLSNMSTSVIGSFFKVDGLKTFNFILILIKELVETLNRNSSEKGYSTWSDIILYAYRTQYLVQPIQTLLSYLNKRKINIKDHTKEDLVDLFNNAADRMDIIKFTEVLRYRNEIYLESVKEFPVLNDAFEKIFENDLVVEEVLFYTSLGSPELINIETNK
ncbi:hypothetical protein CN507_17880 [Bacillus cereus]|nr:hypothetical protein CN507_17880 [Bacillus cereus]